MSHKVVKTSGEGMFAKEVNIIRGESPSHPKDKVRKAKTEKTNSYATENILRSNYDKDKRSGMSPNDLQAKYRKF